jgi:hypothetical protein
VYKGEAIHATDEELLAVYYPIAVSFSLVNKQHSLWRIDEAAKKGPAPKGEKKPFDLSKSLREAVSMETRPEINLVHIWKDAKSVVGM